jgi:hypothetical protein
MRLLALYDDHTHSDRDDTEPLSAYDPHGHFCCKGATLPSLSHARRDVSISVSSLGPHHLGSLEVRCDTTEIQTLVFLFDLERWKQGKSYACGLIPRPWRAYDPGKNTCCRTATADDLLRLHNCTTARLVRGLENRQRRLEKVHSSSSPGSQMSITEMAAPVRLPSPLCRTQFDSIPGTPQLQNLFVLSA